MVREGTITKWNMDNDSGTIQEGGEDQKFGFHQNGLVTKQWQAQGAKCGDKKCKGFTAVRVGAKVTFRYLRTEPWLDNYGKPARDAFGNVELKHHACCVQSVDQDEIWIRTFRCDGCYNTQQ